MKQLIIMNAEEAIKDPRINVFDIIREFGRPYRVITYQRPGESITDYQARHQRNIEWANRITKKPAL